MKENGRYGIVSVNTGKPITVEYLGKPLTTGIYKHPVQGEVFVGRTQMDGDGQADLKHHGGADKAVCVYPYEHYAYWEDQLDKKLDYSAFGENLTVTGLLETEVCIGDIFEIGEVVVQVSQPRFPCFKISSKHAVKDFPARVLDTGYSGFYLRILQEGRLSNESVIVKRSSHPMQVTVASVLKQQTLGRRHADREQLKRMLEVDALAANVKESFTEWLQEA
ncbi:MOSC domain-containing protein [Paenibacillus dokdonensis]|uniref:MOSC domain-containing protein n=1 Tax=Paenibacillus dokdonensis TaxID=2567944 RepID=A0ABU6GQJ8_9BACL|nr:MOSC domain-containing protein [Paenibacillus dokdonensis]MEC0242044.1 MOSC domain-containing protein [Paenibacillus dokdonensis]